MVHLWLTQLTCSSDSVGLLEALAVEYGTVRPFHMALIWSAYAGGYLIVMPIVLDAMMNELDSPCSLSRLSPADFLLHHILVGMAWEAA